MTGPAVPGGSGVSPAASAAAATAAARALATTASPRPGPSSTPGTSQQKQVTPRLSQLSVPAARQHTRQHSISAVYETSIGSQEQIVEKAKQVRFFFHMLYLFNLEIKIISIIIFIYLHFPIQRLEYT